MKDAGSPRVGSGGTLPRMLAARVQTNLFRESGRGGERSTEAPWEEQPRCPALLAVGERENRASPSSASSPPELRRGRGRGAAPAPLARPIRPKIKNRGFPTPSPRLFFFPSALSLPLLKVNVVPLAFSAIFFTLKISTSRRPPEPLVALKIIIIING